MNYFVKEVEISQLLALYLFLRNINVHILFHYKINLKGWVDNLAPLVLISWAIFNLVAVVSLIA